MIIYKCLICKDEMFSDIYKIISTPVFYEVEGKMVTRTEQFDDALIGANASAEEACEGTENSSISGCDIVLNHNLKETSFNKKSYLTYLKGYCKAIKASMGDDCPEKVQEFEKQCQEECKKIVANFKDYQFFTGESMDPEGMIGLLNFREDGITPYMLFFKNGLLEEKC